MDPNDVDLQDLIPEEDIDGIHYFEPSTYPEFREEVAFVPWEEDELEDEDDDQDEARDDWDDKSKESPESERIEDPDKAQDMAEMEDAGRDAAEIAEQTEGAEVAGEAAATAGEAAEAAEAIEVAGAVAAAPEEGVAIGVVAAVVIVVAIVVVLVVVIYGAMMGATKEQAAATTTTTTVPNGGDTAKIAAFIAKACDYVKNPSSFHASDGDNTDCWDFVATTLRNSVDPKVSHATSARGGPDYLHGLNPTRYQVIKFTSTDQLKPGDMLFNSGGGGRGSHAGLFVGYGFCGCSGGEIQASLGDYPPRCNRVGGHYFNYIVRIMN